MLEISVISAHGYYDIQPTIHVTVWSLTIP